MASSNVLKKIEKHIEQINQLLKSACYNCGDFGHFATECKQEKKILRCYNCNMEGHFATECKQEKKKLLCFNCKQPGHYANVCPLKMQPKNETQHPNSAPAVHPKKSLENSLKRKADENLEGQPPLKKTRGRKKKIENSVNIATVQPTIFCSQVPKDDTKL